MKIRATIVKSFNNGEIVNLLMVNECSTSTPVKPELDEISRRSNIHDALVEALGESLRVISMYVGRDNPVYNDALSAYEKAKS